MTAAGDRPQDLSSGANSALEWVLNHWFITAVAAVFAVWIVAGLITGNWTDDDYNNRDCTHLTDAYGAPSGDLCFDRDSGEMVPGG